MKTNGLSPELLEKMDAYWRAANYLSVGQICLYDNPLLKRPLALADVKHMLLGHWGKTPGQNFIYVHLNRVVNQYDLDLMKLQPQTEHPHGLSDTDFDELFTQNKPVIFAFHAYPWLIHRLIYRRTSHDNIHVRGYKEEGTITTPFDMTVLNDLDRFHRRVMDAIDRLPQTGDKGIYLKQQLKDKLIEHKQYIDKHGQDMPEMRNWKWGNRK